MYLVLSLDLNDRSADCIHKNYTNQNKMQVFDNWMKFLGENWILEIFDNFCKKPNLGKQWKYPYHHIAESFSVLKSGLIRLLIILTFRFMISTNGFVSQPIFCYIWGRLFYGESILSKYTFPQIYWVWTNKEGRGNRW